MVSLYKDPKGENVFVMEQAIDSIPESSALRTSKSALQTEDLSRVSELESRVLELEKSLKECELQVCW